MNARTLFVATLLASTTLCWSATATHTDVAYASKSSAQKLDLYLPTGSGPFPLIISIHGGAFLSGTKNDGQEAAMVTGVARGYAVASINYRLSGEAKFPAAIQDVKAAIRFLRANASTYNLDPNKFATWGGSAGGNLAALAATSGGVTALQDDALGNAGVSDAVQAGVDWFGPIYFTTMDAEFAALGQTPKMGATSASTSPETKYIGYTIGTTDAEPLVKQASPQNWIDANDPPFYIQHGTEDRNIPITQSKNFADSLRKVIGASKVTFDTLQGAGHGGSQFNASTNVAKILDFLDKTFGSTTQLSTPNVPSQALGKVVANGNVARFDASNFSADERISLYLRDLSGRLVAGVLSNGGHLLETELGTARGVLTWEVRTGTGMRAQGTLLRTR